MLCKRHSSTNVEKITAEGNKQHQTGSVVSVLSCISYALSPLKKISEAFVTKTEHTGDVQAVGKPADRLSSTSKVDF